MHGGVEEASSASATYSAVPCTDRWGFVASPPPVQLAATERRRLLTENRRLLKWMAMRGSDDFASLDPSRRGSLSSGWRAQLQRRVHKGIPDPLRGRLWRVLSGANLWSVSGYDELRAGAMAEPPRGLDLAFLDQIELDLNRTFPYHVLYMPPRPSVFEAAAADGPACNRTAESADAGGGAEGCSEAGSEEPFEVVDVEESEMASLSLAPASSCASLSARSEASAARCEASASASTASSSATSSWGDTAHGATVDLAATTAVAYTTAAGAARAGAGPGCELFSPGVDLLRTLLRMYALHDPAVSYCQSLNFVAGTLLIYMSPPDAFCAFAHLMGPLGLRGLYLPGLPLLLECLDELDRQLVLQLPRLSRHLLAHGVEPSLYATSWFMTCGLDQFPFAMAVRTLDLVFYERSLAPLFRLALSLLARRQRQLIATRDSSALMSALRALPGTVTDIDAFFATEVAAQPVTLPKALLQLVEAQPPAAPQPRS